MGWVRDHGSLRRGGGIGERPWVSEARWGAEREAMGLRGQVGGIGERPWVSEARWGAE